MAPIALFDKSFLQSLSLDESVLFDHFFYPVICPLFYVETLADLEKAVRQGRTPEQEVGIIADKTPEMHGAPSRHHHRLCLENLLGRTIPMNGQIPVAGGKPAKVDGKLVVNYERAPESEAMSRWQGGEFLEVERKFAKSWRNALVSSDPLAIAAGMTATGMNVKTCKSLPEAKQIVDSFVSSKTNPRDVLKLVLLILGIPFDYESVISDSWKSCGYPPLSRYAPYAAYVASVELFFYVALAADLIGKERASNRIDIAYLFYLPFCMLFISCDKLHRRCAPLVLREDQGFVWGLDLKNDLQELAVYYSQLPEHEREEGIMKFAPYPPKDRDSLVSQLWDRYLRPWRDREQDITAHDPVRNAELVSYLKKFSAGSPTLIDETDLNQENVEAISIERSVRKKKGSFWQVPKSL